MVKKSLVELLNILWRSILCGIVIGLVIAFFVVGADSIMELTKEIYKISGQSLWSVLLFFAVLVLIAFLINFIFSFAPYIDGNYTEGKAKKRNVLKRATDVNWLYRGMAYLFSTYLSFFAGLPFGAERPSAYLGSSLGEGMADYLGRDKKNMYKIFGEASGVAVAVKAPIAGIVYALEESGKKNDGIKFTPMLILGTVLSAVSAYLIAYVLIVLLLGKEFSVFSQFYFSAVSMKYVLYLLLLGAAVGLVSGLFFLLSKIGQSFFRKINIKPFYLLLAAVTVTGIMGFVKVGEFDGNALLGGGSNIITSSLNGEFSTAVLISYLAVKFVVLIICICSGASGGLFIPSMALGALTSGLMCKVFALWGMPSEMFPSLILISASAFMGSFMHLPITAFFLCIELAGFNVFLGRFSFGIIFAAIIIIATSYFVSILYQFKSIKNLGRIKRKIDKN